MFLSLNVFVQLTYISDIKIIICPLRTIVNSRNIFKYNRTNGMKNTPCNRFSVMTTLSFFQLIRGRDCCQG